MQENYKAKNKVVEKIMRERAPRLCTCYTSSRLPLPSLAPILLLSYVTSSTSYTTCLYLLLPLVIFWGEHFKGTFYRRKKQMKTTNERMRLLKGLLQDTLGEIPSWFNRLEEMWNDYQSGKTIVLGYRNRYVIDDKYFERILWEALPPELYY